jgi:anti-sigma B factor antagonist
MTSLGLAPGHRGSDLPAGRTVVRPDGDLGIATARTLRERLISELRPGIRVMIIDLSCVRSCDPAGLAVLVGVQRRAREHGIAMRLIAPSPPVQQLLNATGLERFLTVSGSLREAYPATVRDDQVRPGAIRSAGPAEPQPRRTRSRLASSRSGGGACGGV